jgi:hypothetical protein
LTVKDKENGIGVVFQCIRQIHMCVFEYQFIIQRKVAVILLSIIMRKPKCRLCALRLLALFEERLRFILGLFSPDPLILGKLGKP